jgi:DNA-binding NtrC family response regulator
MNQIFESNLPEHYGSICLAAHTEGERYRPSVLLIEDESFVRDVTREILISAGYRVIAARNAPEAMQIYEERHSEIDLVITDVVLPGESGRLLAVRLQRHNPELKVLFMSGYRDQPEFKGELEEGFIGKPFSSNMLLNRVKLMLDCRTLSCDSESKVSLAGDGESLG